MFPKPSSALLNGMSRPGGTDAAAVAAVAAGAACSVRAPPLRTSTRTADRAGSAPAGAAVSPLGRVVARAASRAAATGDSDALR